MGKLIIISGPSGVGKGTIINKLKEKYQENGKNIYVSISYTTRNKRENEIDGKDYFFVSKEEFEKMINQNGFLEYNQFNTGDYYGTPKDIIFDYLDNEYDVILEIDVNGYKKIKEQNIVDASIFIAPPSMEVLEKRLRKRGTETEEKIRRRMRTAVDEILCMNLYDNVLFNEDDKVDEVVNKIYQLINEKKYTK